MKGRGGYKLGKEGGRDREEKNLIFFYTEGFKSLVKVFKKNLNTLVPLIFDTLSFLCCMKRNTFKCKLKIVYLMLLVAEVKISSKPVANM